MKKMIALVLVLVMMAVCFCGCEDDSSFNQDGGALVVVVGRHSNANMYTEEVLEDKLYGLIEDSFTCYKDESGRYYADLDLTVLVCDGDPERVEITYPAEQEGQEPEKLELQTEANSVSKIRDRMGYIMDDISAFLMSDEAVADDPEVDLLAAIAEGVTILNESDKEVKNLWIYDTGITTEGFLDMRKINIQNGTVDEVLDRLPDGAYVDMSGINVTFVGLGNVCGGQTDLSRDSVFKTRLSDLWNAYFVRCHVKMGEDNAVAYSSEYGEPMLYNEDPDVDSLYPLVSNVPFRVSEKIINEEGEEITPTPPVIILNSLELGFKGDSAEFRDVEAAQAALLSYEDTFLKLKDNPEITIYVVGSKAKTTPDEDVTDAPLSASRAEAVKKLINQQYGIPMEQIQTIDAGVQEFSWRDAVEFPDGTWDTRDQIAQQQNRVVAIIPSTATDLVAELEEAGEL